MGGRLPIQAARSEFHIWINANSLHPLVNKVVNFIWNKLRTSTTYIAQKLVLLVTH